MKLFSNFLKILIPIFDLIIRQNFPTICLFKLSSGPNVQICFYLFRIIFCLLRKSISCCSILRFISFLGSRSRWRLSKIYNATNLINPSIARHLEQSTLDCHSPVHNSCKHSIELIATAASRNCIQIITSDPCHKARFQNPSASESGHLIYIKWPETNHELDRYYRTTVYDIFYELIHSVPENEPGQLVNESHFHNRFPNRCWLFSNNCESLLTFDSLPAHPIGSPIAKPDIKPT